MQFDDVRGMMKLPVPEIGLPAGCNFAAAATLCNLISGISVVLYKPKIASQPAQGSGSERGSGRKFKELLTQYYPWEKGENKEEKANVIYDLVRNPLAHSLGVLSVRKRSPRIVIRKDPLREDQLQEMETSSSRPCWVPLSVTADTAGYVLSVWGLYWGVFHLLKRLAMDTAQMQEAEKRLSRGPSGGGTP
jgi:hypothetical protein